MASSIFNQNEQILQAAKTIGAMSNPQLLLQNFIRQNPNYTYLMDIVSKDGGDIRATVQRLAREKGVDLNELYAQFMKGTG